MFADLPQADQYYIAYSGGLDSTVLLHAFAKYAKQHKLIVTAVHIHHGLSNNADSWQQHCQLTCESHAINFISMKVDATAKKGESVEAVARQARYQAFDTLMQKNDCLLTGHHQNDQAETLLFRLIRGAGLQGLGAMARVRTFFNGVLYRPLLTLSRQQLMAYAQDHQLNWINDESNADITADRNFIRHEILAPLKTRWPSVEKSMARSAAHCQRALTLLNEYLQQDFDKAYDEKNQSLSIGYLHTLSVSKQTHLIRFWLNKLTITLPSEKKTQHIISDVVKSRQDAHPIVSWADIQIRKYQNRLYVVSAKQLTSIKESFEWNLLSDFQLPNQLGFISAQALKSVIGLSKNAKVTIKFRQGGERFKPQGRVGSHPLKKLMQEWQIPPWQRDFVPLIYYNNKLIAVVNYAACDIIV